MSERFGAQDNLLALQVSNLLFHIRHGYLLFPGNLQSFQFREIYSNRWVAILILWSQFVQVSIFSPTD
jgi:hypothetical protein